MSIEVKQPDSFTRLACINIGLRTEMKSVALRSADVTSARRFVSDLQDAISVAGAANATASPSVSAAQPQAAPAAAGSQATRTPTAAGTSATRQRQRVRDGLKLRVRSYLRSILFATWASKASAASELASSPESEEPTDPKKLDGLARQQVRELRDTAFSFGELDLARQIVRRFCDMPEVRQLLTTELLERHRDAVDGETGRLLVKTGKA